MDADQSVSAPLFAVVIEGNPGDAAANRSRRIGRGGSYKSARLKSFERRAAMAFGQLPRGVGRLMPLLVSGRLRVHVHAYWPRRRHLDGTEALALGDVDAPLKATLDALERAGVFDDDARVVELRARKNWDKARPRIEVEVYAAEA